jgi:hypothetical protein
VVGEVWILCAQAHNIHIALCHTGEQKSQIHKLNNLMLTKGNKSKDLNEHKHNGCIIQQ